MKKAIKRLSAAIGIMVLAFLVSIPLVNDLVAKNTANYLENIPLPNHTQYIESVYGAGKYTGNGNGMQYLGCILIKSELELDELRKYYASYAVNEHACLVDEQNQQHVAFIEHGDLSFRSKIDSGNYYIVYAWGDGIEPYAEWDLRGH